ncbi:MAG: hypothetical protein JSV06_07815 [Myxococcales bacterium]|nr:MAG: hypothetical protein JSV06_07815 [Myxococcales bacterium]
MTIEQRHDRDLVAADTADQADRATTNDAHAKRTQEIRGQLTRPITVGEFRRLEKPYRSDALRAHVFGDNEPLDFLEELRKRREAREAGYNHE